ncbi:hypothetical protein DFJ74DRAFT_648551 [Hyaloraphidium curvatum]|nr:hypothetical protein DFJ74DRAFT_698210 [Hyaloraphidium curvatum]KAI9034184.1 hypothetical protein DFJ74DRAFT_648551 [Hyaloraphidium curvatum]
MPPKAKGGGNVISDIFGDTGRKTPPPARATPPPPPAKGKAAAHKAAPASAPPANPPRGRFGPSAAEQKREMEAAGRRRRGDRDGSGSPGPQPREGKDPRPDPREGREARDPRDRDAKDAKDARPGQSGQPEQPKEPRQRGRAADRAEPPAAPERSPSAASSGLSEHELSDASEGRRGRARDSVRSSSPVLKLPNDEASDAGDPPPKNAREDARKRRRTEPPEPLRQLHHPPADSKSPVPGAMHPDTLYAVRGLLTVLSGRKQSTKTPLFIPFDPNFVSAPPRSFPTSVPSLQAIENRVEKGGYPDMATFLEEVAASLGGYLKYLARRLGLLTGHSFADAEAGLSGVELPLAASEGYEQDPVERKKVVNKLMAWGKAVEGADKDLAKHVGRLPARAVRRPSADVCRHGTRRSSATSSPNPPPPRTRPQPRVPAPRPRAPPPPPNPRTPSAGPTSPNPSRRATCAR